MSCIFSKSGKLFRRRTIHIALRIRLGVFLTVVGIYTLSGFLPSTTSPKNISMHRSTYSRKLLSTSPEPAERSTSQPHRPIDVQTIQNSPRNDNETTTLVYDISIADIAENSGNFLNCSPSAVDEFPPDGFTRLQRRQGWILIHILLASYCFWFLAVICDEYYVPAIEQICSRLEMKRDVAGATFMAAAVSSPELFINCVGTFITKTDIGVGTIVGSAVFNILAVPACCGLFAGKIIKLDWWPVTRDCLMYCVAVLGLICTLYDGIVMWYEALFLVLTYFFYISAMYWNDEMALNARKLISKIKRKSQVRPFRRVNEITPLLIQASSNKDLRCSSSLNGVINTCNLNVMEREEGTVKENGDGFASDCADDPWNRRANSIIMFLLRWPMTLLLWITVPDSRKHPFWRFVTFGISVAWIGVISYLVAYLITIVGDTLSIPDSVMGLTILAAGMSVPEAVSSVIVTNQGHGAMGISNSIGSNTFDILLCLGLPWFIKAFFAPAIPGQQWILLNSSGLTYSAISLLTTLFGLYISFAANKFILDWKIGIACSLMYVAFLILAPVIELNMVSRISLPICGH